MAASRSYPLSPTCTADKLCPVGLPKLDPGSFDLFPLSTCKLCLASPSSSALICGDDVLHNRNGFPGSSHVPARGLQRRVTLRLTLCIADLKFEAKMRNSHTVFLSLEEKTEFSRTHALKLDP